MGYVFCVSQIHVPEDPPANQGNFEFRPLEPCFERHHFKNKCFLLAFAPKDNPKIAISVGTSLFDSPKLFIVKMVGTIPKMT